MTPDERTIAVAALAAGPRANHDEIIVTVAVQLRVESHEVESVLQRLRIRHVLNCVSTAGDAKESALLFKYEKGAEWKNER